MSDKYLRRKHFLYNLHLNNPFLILQFHLSNTHFMILEVGVFGFR